MSVDVEALCARLERMETDPDGSGTWIGPANPDGRDAATALHTLSAENAALQARVEAGEWRDIATAPKDGSWLLIWVPDRCSGHAIRGRWEDDRYARKPRPYWSPDDDSIMGINYRRANQPTHWRPLPAPPAGEGM